MYANMQGWPKPYIYGAYTVVLAGKSPDIRSYTVYIYASGQPYKYGSDQPMVLPPRMQTWSDRHVCKYGYDRHVCKYGYDRHVCKYGYDRHVCKYISDCYVCKYGSDRHVCKYGSSATYANLVLPPRMQIWSDRYVCKYGSDRHVCKYNYDRHVCKYSSDRHVCKCGSDQPLVPQLCRKLNSFLHWLFSGLLSFRQA